jgi:predicted flap endonuclease-1-like 5' DNA nuclease
MKSFQLRARAVRAESKRLMAELRQARAEMSRHMRRPTSVAKPAPATIPAPLPVRDDVIIPSRKIRAASNACPKVRSEKPAKAASENQTSEAQTEQVPRSAPDSPKPAVSKARPRKPTSTTPPSVEPMAAARPRTGKTKTKAKADAEAKPPTAPAVEAPPAPKPPRAKKPRPSVAAIIAEGFAPVAALQQAVAAALVQAPDSKSEPKIDRSGAPVSGIASLGPGMVWRLNQLGLRTIGDLAAADPTELRGKLGKLGGMVNVEQWIAQARAS